MNSTITAIMALLSLLLVFSLLACNDEPTKSQPGELIVHVADSDADETPVPNVGIKITPGGFFGITDVDGSSRFELDAGEYVVMADVCCIGPANIHYEEPISVFTSETTEITLSACLRCF